LIAREFGKTLSCDEVISIFDMQSRDQVERHIRLIAKLPAGRYQVDGVDVWDSESQWHLHHANRDGAIEMWRTFLSSGQTRTIESAMRHWMVRFNYL
jgi:hypothetical protein